MPRKTKAIPVMTKIKEEYLLGISIESICANYKKTREEVFRIVFGFSHNLYFEFVLSK